jgi:hypothetical protein
MLRFSNGTALAVLAHYPRLEDPQILPDEAGFDPAPKGLERLARDGKDGS